MKLSLISAVLIIAITTQNYVSSTILLGPNLKGLSEDGKLNFIELAAKYGHQAEEKDVYTKDDYILTLYHIPGNKTRPVLLIHGNTPTADCWIIRGKGSLAITLADQGYDVWAINLRGSRYSRRHRYLNADTQQSQFYNFSFYEQGVYDLPATIDLILQETGQTQLIAIAHSVGTTNLYVMGSEKPNYNDKIKVAISLAPICYLNNFRGLSSLIPLVGPVALTLLDTLNAQEVLSHDQFAPLLQTICLGPFGYAICLQLVFFGIVGYDEKGLEPDFTSVLWGHYPGGSSLKTFKHLLQVVRNKEFIKYDYGREKNLQLYNSAKPPAFDLSEVTMKSTLFVGKEDYLATVKDSERLNASLPNVVHYQVMPYEKFNHIDFIWGRYMTDNFYPHLFEVIDKFD